jgi:UDP:flavonoid glycosyltransferase YjiC (YdhE family)
MYSNPKHLVVTLSSHGYGHAVMTAPLLNALQQRHPELKITLRTTLPLTFLRRKFNGPFEYLPQSSDFGMIMKSAFEVDRDATLDAYRHLHADWQARIADEMRILKEIDAAMVISNIAYLPLIAARQLGIPAIAISCLNWADIFEHYFPSEDEIRQQISAAYRSADCFIRTEPAMPMSGFTTHTIASLASAGRNRRDEIITSLKIEPERRLILVSMGGIKTDLHAEHWPALENIHYIAANPVDSAGRCDITLLDDLGIGYNDALCSSDLLLTKPGYGSFTEAACNGTPVLYVHRDEWPEQPYLTAWLERHVPCRAITLEQFCNGEFAQPLQQLLQEKPTMTTHGTAIEAAMTIITRHLGR